jgi:hypothetical protein
MKTMNMEYHFYIFFLSTIHSPSEGDKRDKEENQQGILFRISGQAQGVL